MSPLRVAAWVVGLALLMAAYCAGHHVAKLTGDAALSAERTARAQERAVLANQRADAINARLIAEGKQADAINEAAQAYQRGKTDAVHAADQAIADLAAGNRRLRDQWATCQRTTGAVSSAAGGHQPDGADGLRAAGIGRILRIVGTCQAQRDALQHALIGERESDGETADAR